MEKTNKKQAAIVGDRLLFWSRLKFKKLLEARATAEDKEKELNIRKEEYRKFWEEFDKLEHSREKVIEQNRTIEMMEKDLKKLRSENTQLKKEITRLKKEIEKAQSVKGEENN